MASHVVIDNLMKPRRLAFLAQDTPVQVKKYEDIQGKLQQPVKYLVES